MRRDTAQDEVVFGSRKKVQLLAKYTHLLDSARWLKVGPQNLLGVGEVRRDVAQPRQKIIAVVDAT